MEISSVRAEDILNYKISQYNNGNELNTEFYTSELYKVVIDCMQEYRLLNNQWISVEDKPLVTHEGKNWRVNEDGPDEFLAAIEVHNFETGKPYWWIRHCTIVGEKLHVIGDYQNEFAMWEVRDIEFYMEIPKPPIK